MTTFPADDPDKVPFAGILPSAPQPYVLGNGEGEKSLVFDQLFTILLSADEADDHSRTTLVTGDFAYVPANIVHAFQIHNTTKVFGVGTAGFERFFHAIGQKTDLTEPQGVYVPDYSVMRAAGEKYWTQFMPEFQFRD